MAVIKSMRGLLESLSLLFEQHLKLLQKELSEDLQKLLGSFLVLLLCLLPLIFGCVFVNISLVFVLKLAMPTWAALLLVGLLDFALGGIGIVWAVRRLESMKFMPETVKELFVTRQVIFQELKQAEQGASVGEETTSKLDDSGT